MSSPQVILITGCGSGFGALSARTLVAAGHVVFATMRDPEGADRAAAAELRRFAEDAPGSLEAPRLDVTDEASVESAVARALELEGRLDVAVNNAGTGMSGLAEAFTADEMRRLFEVNLFGVQRLNRAVLPSMRTAGSGLLIHVSSTFGRHVVPFAAPYVATKWALEALAESYRYELAGSGVEVSIIEPGAFETGHGERLLTPESAPRAAGHGLPEDLAPRMWDAFLARMRQSPADPQRVADAVRELVESPRGSRPPRVVVDPVTGGGVTRGLNERAEEARREFWEALGIRTVLEPD